MKEYFYKLTFIVALLLNTSIVLAQSHVVTGEIIDAESKTAIPGATILEKGTLNGTTTDYNGKYRIAVTDPNGVLEITFVGYKTQEIPINNRSEINIELNFEYTELDEVVVIGYGTQKKKVVTGAISSVSAEDISATPILRLDQAMQGRTPGVQVTQLSGQPGEEPTVRIRGAGTTGYAKPLYIVDGLAVEGIDYLNPGDIESIDVLKDAASAAIYGARAANGVVLVTTKGAKGGDISVTYSGYHGIQNVAKTLDMLNAEEYMMVWNEARANSGLDEDFDLNEIPKHDTDWQNELFEKNAPITNHEISVTGGNEKSSYASSMSYFSQQGIIGGDKSQFDRITGRLNSRHQVTSFLNFGSNLAYSHLIRRGISSNESFNNAYNSALNLDPLTPLYEEDEIMLSNDPYASFPVVTSPDGKTYGISEWVEGEVINPLALLQTQNAETRVDKVVGNIFGELEVIEGLKLRSSFGIDLAYQIDDSYRPLFYLNGAQYNIEKNSVSKLIQRYYTWQWENTLLYSKQIEDHNFSVLLGTTARKENYENLSGFNADVMVIDPNHIYLNMATDTVWRADGGASHAALLSAFGRVTYDYQNKYSFTGIIRRDGSSRFGPNNRYGIFPSLGVSWVISDEEFMPNIDPVNFLKFRASWGVNGNERIGNYQFIPVMDYSRGYIFGGGRYIGASPQYIANEDIHWEESQQLDIALDIGAFNNRLTATFDFYNKVTKGLLEVIPIPAHVGNDPPYANIGSVRNRGIEMDFNWRHVVNNLRYSVGINAAYNKNKMIKVGNEEGVVPGGGEWAVAGLVTRTELNYPIAYFWGYKTDGIFQSEAEVFQHIGSTGDVLQPDAVPGDVRFVDVNNDGELTPEDRTMIGNPTPDWTFGLNASVEYKQFDFSMLIIGTYGNDVFNGAQRQDLKYTNRTTAILDRWTEDNPSNTVPRLAWNDINNNYRVSDLYIEDGSFVRVKNVQVGYTLPARLQQRIKARSVRFYMSVENLFTFTGYTGADPEIGARGTLDIGIDRGIYPQARTFRLGTSITF